MDPMNASRSRTKSTPGIYLHLNPSPKAKILLIPRWLRHKASRRFVVLKLASSQMGQFLQGSQRRQLTEEKAGSKMA